MRFDITARNYQVSDKLTEVLEKKLSKLDKYFSEEIVAKVNFKKQSRDCTLEVMLNFNGKLVRATASGENFYDNLDVILPKLEGQIRKYRTRFDKHSKNNAYKEASLYGGEVEKDLKLVKEKKFRIYCILACSVWSDTCRRGSNSDFGVKLLYFFAFVCKL